MTPPIACVIYDDTCAFCRRQTDRIRRWDRASQFEYLSSHANELLVRFPQLKGENLDSGMRLVESGGAAHAGADAVYAIGRRLPGVRWIVWIYRVPGFHALGRIVYNWIAANRHRLGGGCENEVCDRPPAGPRAS